MEIYYQPPTDKIFEEVKARAIDIWKSYDNTYGYVDKKLKLVVPLKNIKDNFMFMVAMFDIKNQEKLATMLTKKACKEIRRRLEAVGTPDYYNFF